MIDVVIKFLDFVSMGVTVQVRRDLYMYKHI